MKGIRTANYCRRLHRRLSNRGWAISWLTNKRRAVAPLLRHRILAALNWRAIFSAYFVAVVSIISF